MENRLVICRMAVWTAVSVGLAFPVFVPACAEASVSVHPMASMLLSVHAQASVYALNDKGPEGHMTGPSRRQFTPDYVIETIYQECKPVLSADSTLAPKLDSLLEQVYGNRFHIQDDAEIFSILTKSILAFSGRGRQALCVELISRVLPYYQQEQREDRPDMAYYLGRLYIMLGAGYEEVGFWRQSLNIYRKAMGMIDRQAFVEKDPVRSEELKAMLFNNMANIYLKQRDYDQAVAFYARAIAINTALKAGKELFNNYNNMAEVEISRGELGKALEYAFLAQQQTDLNEDPYTYYFIQCNISQIYLLQGKLEIAWEYMADGLAYMQQHGHDMDYGYGCLFASALWQEKGNEVQRLYYLREAEHVARRLANQTLKVKVYNHLSDYYHDNGPVEEAYRYLAMSYTLNDSIRVLDDAKRLADMELVYEMEKVVQENSLLRKESELKDLNIRRQRLVFLLVSLIAAMTIGFISYRLLTQRKRRLAERKLAGQREELNRKEMEMMQKRQTDLKNELEIKNRELTSKVLKLVRNNEFIIHLTEELKQLLLELNPRENAKKEHIRGLMAQLRSQSNDNSDTEFKYYFEQVYSSFYDNLLHNYPQLTAKDLRLCAFLRLGLSTKEISIITFREIRSIESSRNLLRK
ncbi:MAG: tetratricopeptide repeat protein, partial [Bacteroidales bacterium]|nr:tetratricopeptide repeat protein [Bacteroidales bacterium]